MAAGERLAATRGTRAGPSRDLTTERHMAGAENNSMALFVDFENLALGFAGTRKRFEIEKFWIVS